MLSLSGNQLSSFDAASLRTLQWLDLDNNSLGAIHNLDNLQRLDTLSVRKQHAADSGQSVVSSILSQKLHARSICLSSNAIPSLELPQYYHSVVRLDLSSCGLAELPNDFGLRFPNLRRLNLNYNGLKDARPLLNIHALAELHMAGNRMARLRKTAATLDKLASISILDMRDNPFALGIYPPLAAKAASLQLVTGFGHNNDERKTLDVIAQQKWKSQLVQEADSDLDAEHLDRLDDDTKLRRRVYELLLANSCKKIVTFDGLDLERRRITTKDKIWERLVQLGILRKSEPNLVGTSEML